MDPTEFEQLKIGREVARARGRMVRENARSTADEATDLRWLARRHQAYTDYLRTEARSLLSGNLSTRWFRDTGRP